MTHAGMSEAVIFKVLGKVHREVKIHVLPLALYKNELCHGAANLKNISKYVEFGKVKQFYTC